MRRDFTYIDDIVEGVIRLIPKAPLGDPAWRSDTPDPATSTAPFRLYNIGNKSSVELIRFIGIIEDCVGKKAIKRMLPMQAGEVLSSTADLSDLVRDVGFAPTTSIEIGIQRFVAWYRDYYSV